MCGSGSPGETVCACAQADAPVASMMATAAAILIIPGKTGYGDDSFNFPRRVPGFRDKGPLILVPERAESLINGNLPRFGEAFLILACLGPQPLCARSAMRGAGTWRKRRKKPSRSC